MLLDNDNINFNSLVLLLNRVRIHFKSILKKVITVFYCTLYGKSNWKRLTKNIDRLILKKNVILLLLRLKIYLS